MFWTKWVRGVSKLLMAVGIIASVVGGGMLIATEIDAFMMLGIIVIVLGVLISITSVAIIMMISEISINTYAIRKAFNNGSLDHILYDSEHYETTSRTNSYTNNMPKEQHLDDQNTPIINTTENHGWVCECGNVNSFSEKFCRKCGKKRDALGVISGIFSFNNNNDKDNNS